LWTGAYLCGYTCLLYTVREREQPPEIFRLRDLDRVKLTRARLRTLVRTGQAERVGRGLYRRPGEVTELDTVATVSARVPGAVVCLLTALAIHRIGTQLPAEVWIAIDRKARKPRTENLPIRIVRFSKALLSYGIEERTVQGVAVKLTSPARTVVDCFRYRNKLGMDVALEALKDGLATRRVTVPALVRAAQVCRVERVLKPYLEALLA
jgi:predicted transcriptional regulator of viral defense system